MNLYSGPSSTASQNQQAHNVFLTLFAGGDESLAAYVKACEQIRAVLATTGSRAVWRLEVEPTSNSIDRSKQPPPIGPPILLPRYTRCTHT